MIISNTVKNISQKLDYTKSFNKKKDYKNDCSSDVFICSNQFLPINNYIKKCISYLNLDNPVEKAFVIDKDTDIGKIVYENTGNNKSCKINLEKIKTSKSSSLSLIHGHPQQKCKYNKWYTPPISLNDARILCESNLKEIIAVDKFGKTSKLAKKYDNQQFSVEDMQKIEMDIFSVLFKTLPENTINKVKKLGSNKIAADYAFKLATKQQKTKEGMEAINKFWKENADKYKLTYVSDLEYL